MLSNVRSLTILQILALLLIPTSASGQDTLGALNQLRSEVYQLRTEVYNLRQETYNNQSASSSGNSPVSAGLELRISAVEKELQNLTGLIEQFGHQQRLMIKRIDVLETRSTTDVSAATNTQESATATSTQTQTDGGQGDSLNFVTVPVPTPRPGTTQTVSTGTTDPEESYQAAYALMQSSDFAGAEIEFQQFLDNHGAHGLAANAYYWLGESHYARGQMDQASIAFAKGFQTAPSGPKAPDNLLKLGLSLHQTGDKGQACTTLNALLDNYPNANVSILERTLEEQRRMACP